MPVVCGVERRAVDDEVRVLGELERAHRAAPRSSRSQVRCGRSRGSPRRACRARARDWPLRCRCRRGRPPAASCPRGRPTRGASSHWTNAAALLAHEVSGRWRLNASMRASTCSAMLGAAMRCVLVMSGPALAHQRLLHALLHACRAPLDPLQVRGARASTCGVHTPMVASAAAMSRAVAGQIAMSSTPGRASFSSASELVHGRLTSMSSAAASRRARAPAGPRA